MTELNLLDAIQQTANPVFDLVMPFVSWIANDGICWIVLAAILVALSYTPAAKKQAAKQGTWFWSRTVGLTVAVALLYDVVLVNGLIKNLVQRARPFTLRHDIILKIVPPESFSFPSGHTAASFAAATAIFCYSKRWGAAAYVLAALIAFSRMYLYVHYPTDILAGALIGTACGYAAFRTIKWYQTRNSRKVD